MNSAPQFPSNQLPDRIATLSGTGVLQSAEHLYTLRELMEIFNLWSCASLSGELQVCVADIRAKRETGAGAETPTDEEFEKWRITLERAEKLCVKVGWQHAEYTIRGLSLGLAITEADYSTMETTLGVCLGVLDLELQMRLFLYVPQEDAELYRNPMGVFSKAVDGFPSASGDAIEACRCYALGRYTACVFHCMGILQYGLFALADELKLSLTIPLQMAEWCKIINGIEGKIRDFRNEPKSPEKDENLAFYSECGVQFRYFKDAWRNHVAHLREEYDKDQAHSVLIHTREFMEHMSKRVKEIPVPPIDL